MLFYCAWKDEASFLVDAASKPKAIAAATEHAEGTAPDEVREIPVGVFACEVHFVDEEDQDEDEAGVLLEPLEHVELLFEKLEDECTPAEPAIVCPSEADGTDGAVVRCELAGGHQGDHAGAGLVW